MTKDEAAKAKNLKVYDTALPQQWVDDAVLKLLLTASVRCGRIPRASVYDRLVCGTVWSYDDCKIFGEPVALTDEAKELLNLLEHWPC